MKVVFVLSGNYPTNKAYGVTSKESMIALRRLGHEVFVFSRREVIEIFSKKGVGSRLIATIWERSINSRAISKFFFPLWQVFACIQVRSLIPRDTEVIWTREPIVSCLLSFLAPPIIIAEIHHSPRRFSKVAIWILKQREKVIIAPIKPLITKQLGLEESKTPVAFMAVNDNFLKVGESRSAKRNLMKKIVLIGKISNKFQRESYERLMVQVEKLKGLPVQVELTLIGIDSKLWTNNMTNEISNVKIQILGHMDHGNLPSKLSQFDIGIIPYSNNRYFKDTFPLKAVEYAATKILIVASDTKTHRELLGENAIYYDTQDENSLREVLSKIWDGEFDTEGKIQSAYKWSQSKTYTKRVQAIMESVLAVQNAQ